MLQEEEIYFGPERGKAPSRVGFGGLSVKEGLKGAIMRMNPVELASWNLNKALKSYPNKFTETARQQLQDEFIHMPDIENMHMPTLAAVLYFLSDYEPTPENFETKIIAPYMKELIDTTDNKMITRYKAQFLKYIRAIQQFRSE